MLKKYRVGMCNIFLQHTSASIIVNEVSIEESLLGYFAFVL